MAEGKERVLLGGTQRVMVRTRGAAAMVNLSQDKLTFAATPVVKDAEWIAELLRHGLIAGSFVPPLPVQDLREVTRYRVQVTGERSAVSNRIRKLLEGANIKTGFGRRRRDGSLGSADARRHRGRGN